MRKLCACVILFGLAAATARSAEPTVTLAFSTYWGSALAPTASSDRVRQVAFDPAGNIFVYGTIEQNGFSQFPGARSFGPAPRHDAAGTDAYVAKLSPDGARVLWMSFVGGSGDEKGLRLKIGPNGHLYMAVQTYSNDFPWTVHHAGDSIDNMADGQGALVEFNSDGSQLLFSDAVLPGSIEDVAAANGRIVLVGSTLVQTLPAGLNNPSAKTARAGFLCALSSDDHRILFSRFVGRTLAADPDDYAGRVAIDGDGTIVVTGSAVADGYPVTADAFDRAYHGLTDIYLAKYSPDGNLSYGTYVGGSQWDETWDMSIDSGRNVLVVGKTLSPDFPLRSPHRSTFAASEGFILKLEPGGQVSFSSFIGGEGSDVVSSVTSDERGNIVLGGYTFNTWSFETTPGAFQKTLAGVMGSFFQIYNPKGRLDYSTYVAGLTGGDTPIVAVGPSGEVVLAGSTSAKDFPTTPGALHEHQTAPSGSYFNHVTKFNVQSRATSVVFVQSAIVWTDDTMKISIVRQGDLADEVRLDYATVDGAAKAGRDFDPVSGSAVWRDGEGGQRTFALHILSNFITEGLDFGVLISNLQGPAAVQGDNPFIIQFPPAPLFVLLDTDLTVRENAGEVTLRVQRKFETDVAASVSYRTEPVGQGAITPGQDYESVSGTLQFASGETEKTFRVKIIDDALPELPESFEVVLYDPFGGSVMPARISGSGEGSVLIRSDDIPNIDAGPDITVNVGTPAQLAAKLDAAAGNSHTVWELVNAGDPVRIASSGDLSAQVSCDVPGEYRLRARNDVGFAESKSDEMLLTVVDPFAAGPLAPAQNMFDISKGQTAVIPYAAGDAVDIVVYDRLGVEIKRLDETPAHQALWDGRDRDGQFVPAGIYAAVIKEGSATRHLKLVVLK